MCNDFTLDDFMAQFHQVGKLGSIGKVMKTIPGMSAITKQMNLGEHDVERQMKQMQSIYNSMTAAERKNTDLLDGNRRRRVARGAGVDYQTVAQFIKQFEMSRDMMRAVQSMGLRDRQRLLLAMVRENHQQRDPSHSYSPTREPLFMLLACLLLLIAIAWVLLRFH